MENHVDERFENKTELLCLFQHMFFLSRVREAKEKLKTGSVLKTSAKLPDQFISIQNRITVNGNEYALDQVLPYSVRSPNFHAKVDGKDVTKIPSRLWFGGVNGATIFMVKDNYNRPSFIDINDGKNEAMLVPLDVPDADGLLVEVSSGDFDYDYLNSVFHDGDDPDAVLPAQIENVDYHAYAERSMDSCSTFRTIEIAIAYDSTFCAKYNSDASAAQTAIESIVALASQYYEVGGLCTKIQISYFDGYCDPSADIYSELIHGADLLGAFREYWNSHRQDVHRDVAHLFSGTAFPGEDAVGLALVSEICDLENAYAINFMFTTELKVQANLFAHELGHNAGANHYGTSDTGHLMNPALNDGRNGFSETCIASMDQYFSQQNCVDWNEGSQGGTCGGGNIGDGICADGTCCSQDGWCGTSAEHCGESPCGDGNIGNGICEDGSCCSQDGWCGTSAEHCGDYNY